MDTILLALSYKELVITLLVSNSDWCWQKLNCFVRKGLGAVSVTGELGERVCVQRRTKVTHM